jgi:hypothetical protein
MTDVLYVDKDDGISWAKSPTEVSFLLEWVGGIENDNYVHREVNKARTTNE